MSSRFITLLTTALLSAVACLFPQASEAQVIALDEGFDSGAAFCPSLDSPIQPTPSP